MLQNVPYYNEMQIDLGRGRKTSKMRQNNAFLHDVNQETMWYQVICSRCINYNQGLIFRAYRHGRAWRPEIRA